MNSNIVNQSYLFLIFILNGIFIGIVFDVFRILRRSFKTPNFVTYIEDSLFWIISALIIMYSLFIFNNGQFRAYIFIAIFIGLAIYMLFCSKIVINISVKIVLSTKKIISSVLKVILLPINIIYKFVKRLLGKKMQEKFTKFANSIAKFKKKKYNKDIESKKQEILHNKEGF